MKLFPDEDDCTEEWKKAENWRGGWFGFYHAPNDPRVWAPKRDPGMGWTLNFAHRAAWYWLIGLVGGPIAFVLIVTWLAASLTHAS